MKTQSTKSQALETHVEDKANRPRYEKPRIQVMSEKDILNTFQITQSMGAWWAVPTC